MRAGSRGTRQVLLIGRYGTKQKSVEHDGSWLAMHRGLWVFQRLTAGEAILAAAIVDALQI